MEMELAELIEKKGVLKNNSFAYEEGEMSKVICKCGTHFEKEIDLSERLTESEAEALSDMKELVMFSAHEKLKCPNCGTNFFDKDERASLIPIGTYFMGGFKFRKEEDGGELAFWRIKSWVDHDGSVKFEKQERSLSVYGDRISYDPFPWETKLARRPTVDLDLNNIVPIVMEFLDTEPVRTVHDIFELHLFLMWLTQITQDANKMNIVDEIMAPMRNRINDMGLEYFKKALCVFFSIIKFPNLSTIALTKSIMFLSEVIMNCDLPPSSEMKEKGVTAPLDIFNSLTNSYLKRTQNELAFDNNSVKTYVFSPSEHTPDITADGKIVATDKNEALLKDVDLPNEQPRLVRIKTTVDQSEADIAVIDSAFAATGTTVGASTLNIRVRDQEQLDKKKKSRLSQSGRGERGGRSDVTTAIESGTITKYVYDRLRSFSDYTRLVKFFKFYDKHELADLMKKYETDYLINFIDVAYWRERMDSSEFYRLSLIIKDFIRIQTKGKRMFVDFDPDNAHKEIDDADLDYTLMERFDFSIYDDAISMLESMRNLTSDAKDAISAENGEGDMFDRSRYFNKIRDYKKLKNFHDSLAAQYRLMESSGLEKDSSYHKFVNKYAWLEDKTNYDGPIEVQLLRTMSDFMREGHIMMSSQAQYGAKVSRGIYLVARLLDHSTDGQPKEAKRFTIGFTVDRYGHLEFDQLKEYKNAQASDRVKAHVRKWLTAKDITYDERTTDIKFRNPTVA